MLKKCVEEETNNFFLVFKNMYTNLDEEDERGNYYLIKNLSGQLVPNRDDIKVYGEPCYKSYKYERVLYDGATTSPYNVYTIKGIDDILLSRGIELIAYEKENDSETKTTWIKVHDTEELWIPYKFYEETEEKEKNICSLCQNNPQGMYACEDIYIPCPAGCYT